MIMSNLILFLAGILASVVAFMMTESVPEDRYKRVKCEPNDTLIPDPFDCYSFYQCDNGIPIKQGCAMDLCYNPATFDCDYCSNVSTCNGSTTTTTSPPETTTERDYAYLPCPVTQVNKFFKHPTNCNKFFYCERNKYFGKVVSCAVDLWFDYMEQRCCVPWGDNC